MSDFDENVGGIVSQSHRSRNRKRLLTVLSFVLQFYAKIKIVGIGDTVSGSPVAIFR